jgi:hypothetical protein
VDGQRTGAAGGWAADSLVTGAGGWAATGGWLGDRGRGRGLAAGSLGGWALGSGK